MVGGGPISSHTFHFHEFTQETGAHLPPLRKMYFFGTSQPGPGRVFSVHTTAVSGETYYKYYYFKLLFSIKRYVKKYVIYVLFPLTVLVVFDFAFDARCYTSHAMVSTTTLQQQRRAFGKELAKIRQVTGALHPYLPACLLRVPPV
jgi:hypothetical protein